MNTALSTPSTAPLRLPLIRALARRVLPLFAASRATPNQLTAASLLLGLGAAACYAAGTRQWCLAGSVLFIACYVLDNCDGDLARLRGTASRFGAILDTAVDCVVHVVLFAAIGAGLSRTTGDMTWAWLGVTASTGATINSVFALREEARKTAPGAAPGAAGTSPQGIGQWMVFALRELGRADFCFLLVLATVAGVHGWLLACSAVGAHLYWITALSSAARRFHV